MTFDLQTTFDETNCLSFHWNEETCCRSCLIIPKWHPTFVIKVSCGINSRLGGDNEVTKDPKVHRLKHFTVFQKIKSGKKCLI